MFKNMKLQEKFKSVFSYAAGMEQWVNDSLPLGPLQYTFVSDFAIADWYGKDNVKETYERAKNEWLSDYKAFTEIVIALNMLSWAHHALKSQGIDGRDEFIKLYSDMYYQARADFYDKLDNDEQDCDHFFQITD